jgi:hypothetical protein
MRAGVCSGAMCAVTCRAAAAVGMMMTAELSAIVLAAGRDVSHGGRRHHAHRGHGDQQTTEGVGDGFHSTTTIIIRPKADVVQCC